MKERLLRAHLEEGELISDHATLERLGAEAGVPAAEAREMLLTERYAEQVREDERLASALGIQAVPFFAIDRAIATSGAQPPELLLEGLTRAWERRAAQPQPSVVTGGEACGPDGC
jgi:predicted DsbA family dithiol-disulfide isomerase